MSAYAQTGQWTLHWTMWRSAYYPEMCCNLWSRIFTLDWRSALCRSRLGAILRRRADSEKSIWERSMSGRFKQLAMATKRARNMGVKYSGPFSVAGRTGPCIAARNYSTLIGCDIDGDFLGKYAVLNMWAESLNRYCDTHLVRDSEEARLCLGSFLSQQDFDATVMA